MVGGKWKLVGVWLERKILNSNTNPPFFSWIQIQIRVSSFDPNQSGVHIQGIAGPPETTLQSTFSGALQVPWNYTEPALHFDGRNLIWIRIQLKRPWIQIWIRIRTSLIHSQKQLGQWAVYVMAEFYACMLSGWLECNFCTAYAQPNGGGTYTVLNQLTLSCVGSADSITVQTEFISLLSYLS